MPGRKTVTPVEIVLMRHKACTAGFLSQLRDLELRLYKKVMTPQRLTACDLGAREAKTVEVSFEDALIAYIGSSESVVNAMGEAAIERRRRQVRHGQD